MPRGQDDPDFLGPVAVLQEHLIKIAKHIGTAIHSRADVKIVELPNGPDECGFEFDVVFGGGGQGDPGIVVEFRCSFPLKYRFYPGVDPGDQDGGRGVGVWPGIVGQAEDEGRDDFAAVRCGDGAIVEDDVYLFGGF
jgi:hypothetical protein